MRKVGKVQEGEQYTYTGPRRHAYGSDYGMNPRIMLEPGTTVTIARIDVPYVRHIPGNSQTFVLLTFESQTTGRTERASLDKKLIKEQLRPLSQALSLSL